MDSQNIAVIVAHPDDEVLAFGGIMCRHADKGDTVQVLILATGLAARSTTNSVDPKALASLREDTQKAAGILGVKQVAFGDFPDNRMDTVATLDVVRRVETFLGETGASTVYTHHAGDLNVDHAAVARAVLTACRPLPGAKVVRLYAGEVISSSEYSLTKDRIQPTSYVNIAAYLDRKCVALRCYRGEIRDWPHPRSVEAVQSLARSRGSEAGMEAAEALQLLREIER